VGGYVNHCFYGNGVPQKRRCRAKEGGGGEGCRGGGVENGGGNGRRKVKEDGVLKEEESSLSAPHPHSYYVCTNGILEENAIWGDKNDDGVYSVELLSDQFRDMSCYGGEKHIWSVREEEILSGCNGFSRRPKENRTRNVGREGMGKRERDDLYMMDKRKRRREDGEVFMIKMDCESEDGLKD
jgi:hypothetical protein